MSDPSQRLETLARCDAAALKAEAEALLPRLGAIDVMENRSGLVMLPIRDTVGETDFHLGEVLVSEARIHLSDFDAGCRIEGYGMVIGRDLEQAMAMAVIDAAYAAGLARERIDRFVGDNAEILRRADEDRLRRIEATRVAMETF